MKFNKLLILISILTSCQNPNFEVKNKILKFKLNELPEISNVKLSELGFVDIEYIPLETTQNNAISDIQDIKFGNGFFLIKEYNKIFKFQNDGSYITQIGTEGRGPDEFTVAHDVDIYHKNHNIYIVSAWQRKFLVYSEQGNLLRTFHCPQRTTSFRFTEDGILCYNSNVMGNIQISFSLIDTLGRNIKNFSNKYRWNKIQFTALLKENLFYKFDDFLFKKEIYSDTVYVFENKDFRPHAVIEHGEKLLTTEARSKYSPEYLFEHYIAQNKLFEFGDFIYYEFMYDFKIGGNNILKAFIGSKLNDFQVIIDSENGLINDLDNGPSVKLRMIREHSVIISWIGAFEFKKLILSENFQYSTPIYPEKKKELQKLANSLKETDNPVLIMVKLKD
jgi:hypothetical protein